MGLVYYEKDIKRTILLKIKQIYIFDIKKLLQEVRGIFRSVNPGKYKRLKELKDKYLNQRCFIVCTGPSLTFEDLELIKNEYTFGMNSILNVLDKTEWRPTFYGIQDWHVYEKMIDYVLNTSIENIFIGSRICDKKYTIPQQAYIFPQNLYGHEYMRGYKADYKFSDNITSNVYDGFSITYSLIQIANYMGFKEIYLLGCDCSYAADPSKQHFVSSGVIDSNAYLMGMLQNEAYKEAYKYSLENSMKVFNATRGGYLEIFERVKLEDVIKNKEEVTFTWHKFWF